MIYDEIVAEKKADWKPGWTPDTPLAPWDVNAAIAASYKKTRGSKDAKRGEAHVPAPAESGSGTGATAAQ